MVRNGKYPPDRFSDESRFSDELVDAAVELFEKWNPDPKPTWLAYIPSTTHESLVPDFAQRLAARLSLPIYKVLTKKPGSSEQKSMNNSAHQVRNVADFLEVAGEVPSGPVLLVDDIVDSGWTFTVAAWKLRDAGSGPVWPLALARRSSR